MFFRNICTGYRLDLYPITTLAVACLPCLHFNAFIVTLSLACIMETMTKTSRPNWRIVCQIMKVLFESELLGRYCMNNVLHHLAVSSGKKWTCISISPLLYRQQHSIWSLFPLPWKPMGNLQFSANLSASLVQSSCCLAHTLCQAIAEQWFASRWFGVS